MITRTIEFDDFAPEELARHIASWNSDLQAEFFDRLAEEFDAFNREGGYGDMDGMQMCIIEGMLTDRARAFIQKLAEYTIEEG